MDKDFFQLVRDGIRVFNPRDEGTWYDAEGVKEKFGVAPDQVVDVLALMGDTIDNIKGVPGIGEKGARELIVQYGSLENLLAHAAEVKNKRYREGLLGQHGRGAPEPRAGAHPHRRAGRVRRRGAALPRRLARALLRDLQRARLPRARQGVRADRRHDRQDLPDRQHRRRACARWPTRLRAAGRFALRVLPDGPTAMRAAIVGLAFSTAPRDADYVPIGHRVARTTPTACRSTWRSTRCGRFSRTRRSRRSATI